MPMTDGVEMEPCPDCDGFGQERCSHCESELGDCSRCDGSGEIPKEDDNGSR